MDQSTHDATLNYVNNWFWRKEQLLIAAGIEEKTLDHMHHAQCIPNVIYSYDQHQGWWSALSAHKGSAPKSPDSKGEHWYSPASLWWIRRTLLSMRDGNDFDAAAIQNRSDFETEFKRLYPIFPTLYPKLNLIYDPYNQEDVQKAAQQEWKAWISGAYGVCLREFTPDICIRKEALGKTIKDYFTGNAPQLSKEDVLPLSQELSALLLPFSPWERPTSTAGHTLDKCLEAFDLGYDMPSPYRHIAQSITV